MLKSIRNLVIFSLLLFIATESAHAIRESKPITVDSRIRTMVYHPDDVFKYIGYYNYQANIEFGESENIENISMGDTLGWQIVPSGRRLFLKPVDSEATTNMTVITNKRVYYFELHAQETSDIGDPNLIFNLRFIYPDETGGAVIRQFSSNSEPDLSESDKYNFEYTVSGNKNITPIKIFDDGEFTYFQFKDKNTEIPAFFIVNPDGSEEMVNYRIAGKYIVIERVTSRLTLRKGKDVLCVFNETMTFQ